MKHTKRTLVVAQDIQAFHNYMWGVIDGEIRKKGACQFVRGRSHCALADHLYIYVRDIRTMRGIFCANVVFLKGSEKLKDFQEIHNYAKILQILHDSGV